MSTVRVRRPVTRLGSVTYDTYVRLRQARSNRGLRMAYHDGVLEIMSPEYRHYHGSRHLLFVVTAYCKAFGVEFECSGGTTFSKGEPGEAKGNGKEPDESFYIGEAAAWVRNKDTLDLDVDPPPSLWLEIDNWGSSKAKLPLYAGLGVPEVWRFRARKNTLWMGRLVGDGYEEVSASAALPGLTPAMVLDMLAGKASRGGLAWTAWLDDVWFPAHRQGLIDGGAQAPGEPRP